MATGATLTAYDAALKEHYTKDRVVNMVYKNNPFFAMVPKMENFTGKSLPIPVHYGNPQGRSKTFAKAKTGAQNTSSKFGDYNLTRAKDYSLATLDGELIRAAKGDAGSFIDASTAEIDGAINSLTRSLAINLYRGTSGAYGQVSVEPTETASTFVVTLKQASDVANFEVGQLINVWSAESGGSQRSSDGSDDEWYVQGVDRSAGTVTLTGTYDSSGTIAANDYIFVEGDRGLGYAGMEAWVPTSAPGSTAFFGLDRTADVVRLAGSRLDATGLPIEEALIEAEAMVQAQGQRLTHFFCNNKKAGDLKKSLGSKVQYVDVQVTASISFRTIEVQGDHGPILVVPDHNCPNNKIWGVNMDYVKLYSLGPAVSLLDEDGLKMLRMSDEDGYEVRAGFYGNLGIKCPSAFINVTV